MEQVQKLSSAERAAGIRWQLVSFANALVEKDKGKGDEGEEDKEGGPEWGVYTPQLEEDIKRQVGDIGFESVLEDLRGERDRLVEVALADLGSYGQQITANTTQEGKGRMLAGLKDRFSPDKGGFLSPRLVLGVDRACTVVAMWQKMEQKIDESKKEQ